MKLKEEIYNIYKNSKPKHELKEHERLAHEIDRLKILIRHLAEGHISFLDVNYNENDELVYEYFFEQGFDVKKMNKLAYGSYVRISWR